MNQINLNELTLEENRSLEKLINLLSLIAFFIGFCFGFLAYWIFYT